MRVVTVALALAALVVCATLSQAVLDSNAAAHLMNLEAEDLENAFNAAESDLSSLSFKDEIMRETQALFANSQDEDLSMLESESEAGEEQTPADNSDVPAAEAIRIRRLAAEIRARWRASVAALRRQYKAAITLLKQKTRDLFAKAKSHVKMGRDRVAAAKTAWNTTVNALNDVNGRLTRQKAHLDAAKVNLATAIHNSGAIITQLRNTFRVFRDAQKNIHDRSKAALNALNRGETLVAQVMQDKAQAAKQQAKPAAQQKPAAAQKPAAQQKPAAPQQAPKPAAPQQAPKPAAPQQAAKPAAPAAPAQQQKKF